MELADNNIPVHNPRWDKLIRDVIIFLFLIMFGIGCFSIGYKEGKENSTIERIIQDTCECNRDTLTFENLKYQLEKEHVKYVEIVLAQIQLETASLTSNVCKTKNNLLGFQTNNGYLTFNNWQSCVSYLKSHQDRHYKGNVNYYEYLRKLPWSMDSQYVDRVKCIVSSNLNK